MASGFLDALFVFDFVLNENFPVEEYPSSLMEQDGEAVLFLGLDLGYDGDC